MPRPDFEGFVPDPRLDPYRDRAGVLALDGETVGHVLVETQEATIKAGGFAWWTRWDPPEEIVLLGFHLDGEVHGGVSLLRDELTEAIEQWGRGVLVTGRTYQVTWLDQAESDRVHREVFGHHH